MSSLVILFVCLFALSMIMLLSILLMYKLQSVSLHLIKFLCSSFGTNSNVIFIVVGCDIVCCSMFRFIRTI